MGQSKSNASYLLCHAIYKLDTRKFQRTSPQNCWKAYLFFIVVPIFADILLPPTNKSMHSHPVKVALCPLQSLTQGILQCLVIYIMVYSMVFTPKDWQVIIWYSVWSGLYTAGGNTVNPISEMASVVCILVCGLAMSWRSNTADIFPVGWIWQSQAFRLIWCWNILVLISQLSPETRCSQEEHFPYLKRV